MVKFFKREDGELLPDEVIFTQAGPWGQWNTLAQNPQRMRPGLITGR